MCPSAPSAARHIGAFYTTKEPATPVPPDGTMPDPGYRVTKFYLKIS
jgi:hypothetical protein